MKEKENNTCIFLINKAGALCLRRRRRSLRRAKASPSSMPENIPIYNGPMDLFDIPNYLVPTKMPLLPTPPFPATPIPTPSIPRLQFY